jgi:hypothetical protein
MMEDRRNAIARSTEAAIELVTAPVRRLVYATPQLVAAHPFGMLDESSALGSAAGTIRRLLQTGPP